MRAKLDMIGCESSHGLLVPTLKGLSMVSNKAKIHNDEP